MPNGRKRGERKSKKVFRSSRKSTSQSGGGTVHLVLSSDYKASEINKNKSAIDTLKAELLTAFKKIDSKVTSITLTNFTDSSTAGKVQIDVTVLPSSVTPLTKFSTSVSSINNAFNKIVKKAATPPAAATAKEFNYTFKSQYTAANLSKINNVTGAQYDKSKLFGTDLQTAVKAASSDVESIAIKSYTDKGSGNLEVKISITPKAGKTPVQALITQKMIDDAAVKNGIGPASTPPPAGATATPFKYLFKSQYKAADVNKTNTSTGAQYEKSKTFKTLLETAVKAAHTEVQSIAIKGYIDKDGQLEVTIEITPSAGKTADINMITSVMIEQAAAQALIGPAPNPIKASIFTGFVFNFKDPQTKVSTFRKAFEDDLMPLNANIVIDAAYQATKGFTGNVTGKNKISQSGGGGNYIIVVFNATRTLTLADISKYINKDRQKQTGVAAAAYLTWGFTVTTISLFTNIASLEGRAPPPAIGDKSEKTIQEFNVTFNKQIGVSGGPTYTDAIKALNDALNGDNGSVSANTLLYKVRKIYAYNPDGAYPTDLLSSGPAPGGKTMSGYPVRYIIGITSKNKRADGTQDFNLRGISSAEFDIVKKAKYAPDITKPTTRTSTLISSIEGENFVQKSWFSLRDTSAQVYTFKNTPTNEYTFILNTKNVIEYANGPEADGWMKDVMMFGPITVTHIYTVKSTAGVVTGGDEFLPNKPQTGGGMYYIIRGKSGVVMDVATVQKAILKNTNVGGYLYWPMVGGHPVSQKTLSVTDLDKLKVLGTNPKKPSLAAQALAATAAAAAGAKAAATKAATAVSDAAKVVAQKTAALASAAAGSAKDAAQKALDAAKGLLSKAKDDQAQADADKAQQDTALIEQQNAAKGSGITVDPNGIIKDPNGNTLNPADVAEPGVTVDKIPQKPPTEPTTPPTTPPTTSTPPGNTSGDTSGDPSANPSGDTSGNPSRNPSRNTSGDTVINPDSCTITKITKTDDGIVVPPKLPKKVGNGILDHIICRVNDDAVPPEFKTNRGSIGGEGMTREQFATSTSLGQTFFWVIYSPSDSNTYYYITGDSLIDVDNTIRALDEYKKILFDPELFQFVVNTLKREHATQLNTILSALIQSTTHNDQDESSKIRLKQQILSAITKAQEVVSVPTTGGSRRGSRYRKSYPNKSSKLRRKDKSSYSTRRR